VGIVVGIDGSDCSKTALSWALTESRLRRTSLTAIIAWAIPPIAVAYGLASTDEDFLESVRMAASELLDAFLADVAEETRGIEMHRAVIEGRAAEVLVEASTGAELLVVGSRGLGGFKELVLGSVSHQCAQHARCPVVIVRQAP
jgi:nucleotide-binding universal stress UspA family protein